MMRTGNPVDRGITAWQQQIDAADDGDAKKGGGYEVYEPLLPQQLKSHPLISKLPFMPNYVKLKSTDNHVAKTL